MPKYVFVTNAGYGMEAGKEIETDNLHPALRQHVRLVSKGRDLPEQDDEPEKTGDEPEKTEPEKPARKPAAAKVAKDPDDDNT